MDNDTLMDYLANDTMASDISINCLAKDTIDKHTLMDYH